ncbi:MAG: helix-turn-helix transcriptional regulator [Clostridia bacterium]|nr:helix-turn-helix transcriptional regulator [Clostridia bacterium]
MITIFHHISEKPLDEPYDMHAHNSYEILLFLSGDADYYVEGTRYTLHHGDIMIMRRSEFHHLILKSNRSYERIVLNFDLPIFEQLDPEHRLLSIFDDRQLGKYNHYSASSFPENHWKYFFDKILNCKEEPLRVAFLFALLGELYECYHSESFSSSGDRVELIYSVVRYINENINSNLSLDMICEHFYLSKTHLNRLFKQATGSTVWNYILIKRLLRARELLSFGESPTNVYLQCGFQDYTTFFRAYKKQFNVSPKKDLRQ